MEIPHLKLITTIIIVLFIILIILLVLVTDEIKKIIKLDFEPVFYIVGFAIFVLITISKPVVGNRMIECVEKEYGLIIDKQIAYEMVYVESEFTEFVPCGVGNQTYGYKIEDYNITFYKKSESDFIPLEPAEEELER